MGSVNRVILVGRLGKDAEFKSLPSGTGVLNFSLATSEVFKDREGARQERTEWHAVVVYGPQAESRLRDYLVKGKEIFVEGKLETRSWDDKVSGQKRYKTEVKADRIVLLGSGGGQRPGGPQYEREHEPGAEAPSTPIDVTDDDIPF